ncbi:helix-turn-helix domain-containing protein, partial [Rhizobium johnstonii]|uniref:Lrp/AsnC ligand binding domain-containing protein n=1 Tax=Rhizobium johnstonii TaxID=3019933 RepID=UPI003F96F994
LKAFAAATSEWPLVRQAWMVSGDSDFLLHCEAEIIRDALSANDGDVRRTIEALGIQRKTFYDKLQRHGINRGGYISRK